MVQGTASDVGKSLIVAAFCRMAKRRGIRVAPFKPQNMSLNSAVTIDGGEIGRAQALQAQAAGLEPRLDFNPVLIKPESNTSSQLILHGKAVGTLPATSFLEKRERCLNAILTSYKRLQASYELIVVEGAGSPAEVNLRAGDLANMGFAECVNCPVILLGNIDKGGVFAHLTGTLEVLSREDQRRFIGVLINCFRGDSSLLAPGIDFLEKRLSLPCFGVLPYLENLVLDAEDALVLYQEAPKREALKVTVPVLPRISNHTDFDALRLHSQVDFSYVAPGNLPKESDLIIIPGSKSVQEDLKWLLKQGWRSYLERHLRYGGKVLGICGGYQMLGKWIHNPFKLEGSEGSLEGFGFLDLETNLEEEKLLRCLEGAFLFDGYPLQAYEIHCGRSSGADCERPFSYKGAEKEGAFSLDKQVAGTYLHGLFDKAEACQAILSWAGLKKPEKQADLAELREESINRLADAVEAAVDFDFILDLAYKYRPLKQSKKGS